MKTICILVPEATVAKNLLRGAFWPTVLANTEVRILLVCTSQKSAAYSKEFGSDRVTVVSFTPYAQSFAEKVGGYLSRNGLRTGTVTMNQMRTYVDDGGLLALIPKRLCWYIFGRSKWFQMALRRAELRIAPHASVAAIFDAFSPDLVYSSHIMNHDFDIPFLREAKRRGVATMGMTRGWDNFTAHGVARVIPDKLLLQDEYLRETGVHYQFLKEGIMAIVGFPQNDLFADASLLMPRAQFLESMGLAVTDRYVLFGALGDYLVPLEWEMAKIYSDLVVAGKLPKDRVLVYRAHPTFQSQVERIKQLPHVIHEKAATYTTNDVRSWEMGKKEMCHYMNVLYHSDVVLTSGSTVAIDALAMGKPAISVTCELSQTSYWLSARRFLRNFTHWERVIGSGGVILADTPEKLTEAVTMYLRDPEANTEGRIRTTTLFVGPQDGRAGERIAQAILSELKG
jgi:CDP-Glycerol:Poly(glycerophosphate) glycerophosphotransferase